MVGSGGIRTHAPEETGALIQRLRPLGHATVDDRCRFGFLIFFFSSPPVLCFFIFSPHEKEMKSKLSTDSPASPCFGPYRRQLIEAFKKEFENFFFFFLLKVQTPVTLCSGVEYSGGERLTNPAEGRCRSRCSRDWMWRTEATTSWKCFSFSSGVL